MAPAKKAIRGARWRQASSQCPWASAMPASTVLPVMLAANTLPMVI